MNDRQLCEESNSIYVKVCKQLNIDPESVQQQSFEDFYVMNQHKYNMDQEAWLTLWEGQEEKKQKQLYKIQDIVEQEQLKAEEYKKQSYSELINQLWQCQNIKIQRQHLDKLRSGNLRELRFHIEQQMSELMNKKSFVPRYKEINIALERQLIQEEQMKDKPLEEQILKFRKPLEKKKRIDPNLVFVGLDKLAPRSIKINQYEFDVENYEPEDDINYDLEQQILDQIEQELREGKRSDKNVTNLVRRPQVIKKKGDQVQEVQKRNQEQTELKRQMLLKKQEEEDRKVFERKLEKQREVKQKIVENFMRQQDKKENQKRQQLVDELKNQQLQEQIADKKKRLASYQKQKNKINSKKLQVNQILDEYDQRINQMMEDYQDGLISAEELQKAIDEAPIEIKDRPKTAKSVKKHVNKKPTTNTRLEKEILNLEHKHNVEMRMLVEREQLAELNRQKSIKNGVDPDMLTLFEKQREAGKQRIQNILTKQQMETQNLMRLYSR